MLKYFGEITCLALALVDARSELVTRELAFWAALRDNDVAAVDRQDFFRTRTARRPHRTPLNHPLSPTDFTV